MFITYDSKCFSFNINLLWETLSIDFWESWYTHKIYKRKLYKHDRFYPEALMQVSDQLITLKVTNNFICSYDFEQLVNYNWMNEREFQIIYKFWCFSEKL